MTKASLSGEWQLRVTHTPLPFIYHVHRVLASTSNREHPGPRKVTWLDNLVTGGALAPVSDRSSHSLSTRTENEGQTHSAAGAFLDGPHGFDRFALKSWVQPAGG